MKLTTPLCPVEETFDERFHFLSTDERELALACLKDPSTPMTLTYPRNRKVFDALVDLVGQLVTHIDLEADWEKHKDKSPEDVERELREAGYDPDAMFESFRERMKEKFGFNIKSAAEYAAERKSKAEREYRQLMGTE